jgi:hypothetical protein
MIEFNNQLDNELKGIGFDNCKEMLSTADHLFDFTYLYANVAMEKHLLRSFERVQFFFILSPPLEEYPHFIRFIKASTDRDRPYKDDSERTIVHSSYLSLPLQTKDQMIHEILSIENAKRERMGQAFRILLVDRKEKMQEKLQKKGRQPPPF